jgi:molecular chaperone DnaK
MKSEAAENAESDQRARETADKLNMADSLIFQTEKQLSELSDKMSETEKESIEGTLNKLKEAYNEKDLEKIDSAMNELNTELSKFSENLYKNTTTDENQEDFTNVEFEEVK